MPEVDPFERKSQSPPAQESSAPADTTPVAPEKPVVKDEDTKSRWKFDAPSVTLIESNGTDSDEVFEVVSATSKAIIIKRVVPDMKKIKVSGVELEVDLNALKRMSPNATLHGKPVELLIAAATLA